MNLLIFIFTAFVHASPLDHRPFDHLIAERELAWTASSDLVVDLGYERYQGVHNDSTGLNTWKGIRYAAPPVGSLRWQKPQAPTINRNKVLRADVLPENCPQAFGPTNDDYNFTGSEDCLFLSVYAPPNKTNLPVLVWIHGGGYGGGSGNQDLSSLINTNNNDFIGVAIQYRLGVFGFLSSDEVYRYGTTNAGLKDQTFALQWVQSYIYLFGGNASAVTIGGQSAGAGSVMLQAMAFGGELGTSLFRKGIAASPYLPQQWGYADFVPTRSYYAIATAVGCFSGLPQGNSSSSIFQCLVDKDTTTLQKANADLSGQGRYGEWIFLPVTDGGFIQQLPSQQLLKKQVNGATMLVSNVANEAPVFTPQDIVTEDDFVAFLRYSFPLFTNDDIEKVLYYYPSSNASDGSTKPSYATSGTSGATALNQSTFGSGQQQRANNLHAETTFVCPSYWLSEAFTDNARVAYRYQYSVIGALHTSDVSAYFGPPTPNQGPDFTKAVMSIWGNFITTGNPSISAAIVAGSNHTDNFNAITGTTHFPPFSIARPYQLNLNQTGGVPYLVSSFRPTAPNYTQFADPGLQNSFEVVDAYSWEGGRGTRCDFWRSMASRVPQ